MKIQKQREIVIEFERVQLIRKRAKTQMINCRTCRRETDFILLIEAAKLFSTHTEQLFQFIKAHGCHFEIDASGEIFICLVSLLTQMKGKTNISRIKMIGE
ncbi:MAG TPA: hypothetical protein PKE69_26225 [Pyrinomonadaceae bacterium]|nr:hypothetical protein [Pyrinomonadaceae bacterium]